MKNFYKIIILTFIMLFNHLSFSQKHIIEINKGNTEPISIAITNFQVTPPYNTKIANDILEVITKDLYNSGMFRIVNKEAHIEKSIGIHHIPSYASWRAIGASFTLNGDIKKLHNDTYEITFILWDNLLQKRVSAKSFETSDKLWRKVAHKIADNIYQNLTGQRGYFETKIAYIAEAMNKRTKIKRLAIMDYDGYNKQFLTDGKSLVLTPRLSPDGKKLLYVSYEKRVPKVFIMDIQSGQKRLLGNFPGMSYAPRFSPNGKKAIMSISNRGVSNIYEIDLHNFKIIKLTDNGAINTSPCYSPDGSKIVYNSDVSGSKQLYLMNANGSNSHRITFGDGVYSSPVWSPRGDLIACTRTTSQDGFMISIIKPDGSGHERILAKGFLVEGPSWAPNGSVVSYTKYDYPLKGKNNLPSIHFTDVAGYKDTKIITEQGASAPEWSR